MQVYILLALLLTLGTSADTGFESLNLDPQLVQRTNNAIACAKAELSKYDCSYLDGSSGLLGALFGGLGFNGYQLYTALNNVVVVLAQVKTALGARGVVVGDGNTVSGKDNFVIGNYNLVNGNNDWIIASGVEIGKRFQCNNILVIGNYQINLDRLSALQYGPNQVIRCLDSQQKANFFGMFGFQRPVHQQNGFNFQQFQPVPPPQPKITDLPAFPLLKILF